MKFNAQTIAIYAVIAATFGLGQAHANADPAKLVDQKTLTAPLAKVAAVATPASKSFFAEAKPAANTCNPGPRPTYPGFCTDVSGFTITFNVNALLQDCKWIPDYATSVPASCG